MSFPKSIEVWVCSNCQTIQAPTERFYITEPLCIDCKTPMTLKFYGLLDSLAENIQPVESAVDWGAHIVDVAARRLETFKFLRRYALAMRQSFLLKRAADEILSLLDGDE